MSESAEDHAEFARFLYREARLMDENRYEEWFSLWTKDALYWLPCNGDDIDPAKQVSLVYETLDKIQDRVLRLQSKFAHAQSPKSRLIRVVGNIDLESASETELIGTSTFVLGEVRNDNEAVWMGRNHHILVRTPAGLRMRHKKVLLLNNDSTIGNLTFLI